MLRSIPLTVFHTLSVRRRVDSKIKYLASNLNRTDGELPLGRRHLLHVFRTVDTSECGRIVEEFGSHMLHLQALPVKSCMESSDIEGLIKEKKSPTSVLVLLRECLIPGLVPIPELEVAIAQDLEGVFIDRSVEERSQAIVNPLADRHQFDHGHQSHVILDRQWVLQEQPAVPYTLVIFENSRSASAVRHSVQCQKLLLHSEDRTYWCSKMYRQNHVRAETTSCLSFCEVDTLFAFILLRSSGHALCIAVCARKNMVVDKAEKLFTNFHGHAHGMPTAEPSVI